MGDAVPFQASEALNFAAIIDGCDSAGIDLGDGGRITKQGARDLAATLRAYAAGLPPLAQAVVDAAVLLVQHEDRMVEARNADKHREFARLRNEQIDNDLELGRAVRAYIAAKEQAILALVAHYRASAPVPASVPGVVWVDDGEGGHFRAGPVRGDTYRADDGAFCWVVMGLCQDEDDVEADGCIRGEGETMEAVRAACEACARRKVAQMAEALGMRCAAGEHREP